MLIVIIMSDIIVIVKNKIKRQQTLRCVVLFVEWMCVTLVSFLQMKMEWNSMI